MGTLLCDRTLIPTAKGLVRVGDLKVGDKVFTEFGNPVDIVDIVTGFENIATIQLSHGVDWDNQNRPYCLNVSMSSGIIVREQNSTKFDEIMVEKTTKEPINQLASDGMSIINRWVMKRGQKLETDYINPGSDIHDNVVQMFSDNNYRIPEHYMHGSRMQKECVRDVIQRSIPVQEGVYYLNNVPMEVLIQVSELLEDLGHQVYSNLPYGIMWVPVRVQDMQIIDIINLGYERRVWGIKTDGDIPYQAGAAHALVMSI